MGALSTIGNYSDRDVPTIGLDVASDEVRFALVEATSRSRTIDISGPSFAISRTGQKRGIIALGPVYSNNGTARDGGISTLAFNVDVADLAGEVAPGVNRITSP